MIPGLLKLVATKARWPMEGWWRPTHLSCRRLILAVAIIGIVLTTGVLTSGPAAAKYAALVLDADSGGVLFSRNADTRNYPASLTKMMTLYMLFEAIEQKRLRMDSDLLVSRRAAGQPPSKLGLREGETIKVETAVLALVTKSANDVATVVAEALAGTEANFARKMTARARQLGMQRTTFRNASGLPNRKQLSTAADMARLAMALHRDFPQHYHYFSTTEFRFHGRRYRTHNNVLLDYPGAEGMKTGYIRASGFNLVTSATRDGQRLIGVVFGGRTAASRDKHMRKILDLSFKRLSTVSRMARYVRPAPDSGPSAIEVPKQFASVPRPALRPADLVADSSPTVAKAVHTAVKLGPQRGAWSVQVGAYWQEDKAARRLEALANSHPDLLADGERTVSAKKAGRRVIYRARFRGMPEDDARDTCRLLSRQNIDCLAIPPTNASLQTANSAG